MGHLYVLYRFAYLIYDLLTFGRHPLVSAFFIGMGVLALAVYWRRGRRWRR